MPHNINNIIFAIKHLSENTGVLFFYSFRSGTREELIMTFLALLELIKLKSVVVEQQRLFAEIYICIRDGEH